jgi:hypothetical protein
MEKTESNETQAQDKPDIIGFIDKLNEELNKKNIIIDLEGYRKKILAILEKKQNKPVLVKELFPNFKTGTKDHKFLESLTDSELVRPLCGGPWKADSTIILTKKGRDIARDHKIPVLPLVFVSYSHKDKEWKNLLESHLKVLEQYYHMETWDDEQIPTGKDFKYEIIEAIESADAAILLISADFLSSDFIRHQEIPRILNNKADVFPILLRPCAWDLVEWLSQKQIRLAEGKALSEWTEGKKLSEIKPPAVEKCFASITEEIASRLKLTR